MRKTWLYVVPVLLLVAAVALAVSRAPAPLSGSRTTAYASGVPNAVLPIVMVPEATPTTPPTSTPAPTPTPQPTPTPTIVPTATSEPLPGNSIVNGSFEDGWTDLPPAPGFLINQQPNGWRLTWLDIGQPLWDDSSTTVQGIPEALHKLVDQLPPHEQPGGSNPLILDGTATYKMFHFGAPFGSQLYQVVGSLPPGSQWRFTVPVQAHTHGDNDTWAAESGVWAITSATQSGGWVPAGQMGDRVWFFHNVEFAVPGDGRVELLIRVKSKWFRAKDFFIDRVELRRLGNGRLAPYGKAPLLAGNSATWGPRALDRHSGARTSGTLIL